MRFARYALIAAGIALAVYGFLSGEAAAVMRKAVTVCLECIGIG